MRSTQVVYDGISFLYVTTMCPPLHRSQWAQEAAEAWALISNALYHDAASCPGAQCDIVRAIVDAAQGKSQCAHVWFIRY